ncbi:MAG: hypothetical protein QM737_18830 [Ferruginibacter sp.]
MKKNFLIITLLFSAITCYSQTKKIIGTWRWRDSSNTILLVLKEDQTIEKTTARNNENIWIKTPKTGSYVFNNGTDLIITWADKSIEKGKVKFNKDFTMEIQFSNSKNNNKKTYLFNEIVEEVVPDK